MRLLAASLACLLALNLPATDTHAAVITNGDFSAGLNGWTVGGNVVDGGGGGGFALLSTAGASVINADLIRGPLGIDPGFGAGQWIEGSYLFQELASIPAGGGTLTFNWEFSNSAGLDVAFWSLYDGTDYAAVSEFSASSGNVSFAGLDEDTVYRLGFGVVDGVNGAGESTLSISNVVFTPALDPTAVPEPTTLAMLGFSCGGLAVGVIRKRRNLKVAVSADAESTV